MKAILKYFLRGLLIFVPIAITVFILIWAFGTLDTMCRGLFKIDVPGLGIAITIVAIFLIGFVASNFLGGKIFAMIDRMFTKLPLVKLLYNSIKDLIEAFAGEKKKFNRPVLVTLIENGAKAIGFITRDSMENIGLADHVAVYLPQSYNFAGSVLIFAANTVKPLDIDSTEAMAFIVSGGVSGKIS